MCGPATGMPDLAAGREGLAEGIDGLEGSAAFWESIIGALYHTVVLQTL